MAIDDEAYAVNSPHTMTLVVGLADYPVSTDALHPTRTYTFDVTVVAATCDCTLIQWNEPENIPLIMNALVVTTPATQTLLEAGPLAETLTNSTGARACDHTNNECNYDYTITAKMSDDTALPTWIVYTQPDLVATPLLAEHIGTWEVKLEQIRTSNGVTTVYTAARIIVDCTIISWDPPTMPTVAEGTYTIFDAAKTITMAPAFAQQPPCGYTAN